MPARVTSFLAVLVMTAIPTIARSAGDKEASQPTLVIRLQSIDDLMADVKYLATAAGHEEEAKQFDAVLQAQIGDKGLEGLDTKKPLGLYTTLSPDVVSSTGVILVPVSDQKAFLDLLERLNQPAEKGADGIYTISPASVPMPIYLRFANHYVYATAREKSALAKDQLLDPAKVLAAAQPATLSVVARLDQIPDGIKQIGLQQFELEIANAKEKKAPGETKAQKTFKEEFLEDFSKRVSRVVQEGGEVAFRFNVDRTAHELTAEASLSGKPDSTLAANIADLRHAQSVFGGLHGGESAVSMLVHVALPADLRKAFEPVVDEGVNKTLENEKNETKRKEAEKVLKALEPTFKAGELDAAFSFRGPTADKLYTLVAGIKLTDGAAVERAVRNLAKNLPERDRERIKFDVDTAGGIKIHRIDAQKQYDAKARKLLGENPIYFAVRDNAAVITAGPEALSAVKDVLAAEPKAAPQFRFEVSLARLADLMADENKAAPQAAKEAFGKGGKGGDRVRFTVEGGSSLKVHFVMGTQALKFFSLLDAAKRGNARESAPQEPAAAK